MFNHALVEEVEKFEILFAKVTAARALPLDTIDFGTGLPCAGTTTTSKASLPWPSMTGWLTSPSF